ncbi:MAG: hypothetical protein RMA76_02635 [Deltaproteobacteria bacterium]|jgi:hypothetical protein
MKRPLLALLCLPVLYACPSDRDIGGSTVTPPGGTRDGGGGVIDRGPCGNGVINGTEACDGNAFLNGADCSGYNLGDGQVSCSASCQITFQGCSLTDYCTANGLYANGQCDPCERLGGVMDPECATACGMDGVCADRFEPLIGEWTCRRLNTPDPDCGMCGNGIIEGNEICDSQAIPPDRFRCDDWGYLPGGEIACKPDCTPNFSACRHSVCGDGNVEGTEMCDAANLNGATCESRGFAGGTLGCNACTFDESACITPGCGNGIQETDLSEECDGQDGITTCEDLGFAGGTVSCTGACTIDSSACVSPGCGNGIIEEPLEDCEGMNLDGATCESLGFLQGTLSCSSSSCTYDTTACIPAGCGNDIIEASEQCEGANLNGASCVSLGFLEGKLACDSMTCQYDTSMCPMPGCGNNIIETGEVCDGTALAGQSCTSMGFSGGTLGCSGCLFDFSQCSGTQDRCGNGAVQGAEPCDQLMFASFAPTTCDAYGMPGGGNVACTASCGLQFQTCNTQTDVCNFNSWYGDGVCDDCELYTPVANLDTDCSSGCGADGACRDYWLAGEYTCVRAGFTHDPDCGCGNGTLDTDPNGLTIEVCDGTNFAGNLDACSDWGFTAGRLTCTSGCSLDFSQCY